MTVALLLQQSIDEAIAVFELNVEWEPETVNVYDSLGEAHMMAGNHELAILNFEKVLELDPENQRAKRILESLESGRESSVDR